MTKRDGEQPAVVPWFDQPYVNLETAAGLLNISRSGLYAMQRKGQLSFMNLLGKTVVPSLEIKRLLAEATPWVPSTKTQKATAVHHAKALMRHERAKRGSLRG